MIGQTISHYKIIEKLGEGGMGVVYKAEDSAGERIVALKVLNREAALDADVQRRFLREAGAGAGLVHPNIVQMFEAGEFEGQHFICLEFVDGHSLRSLLESGPLPPRRAVEIGMDIGSALQTAHNNGIIHRDIKAENIMITSDGVVKVMDFGLAKVQNASMLTREGDIVGTIAYMSPEQATGDAVDHRTDIFSFGVLLYELVTGKLPFWAAYETAIVYSILNSEPASIRQIKDDVPEALEKIIFKALAKDRQNRYQKVEELTSDLSRLKAYYDGDREVLPTGLELVAGSGDVPGEEGTISQVKLAARSGFQAGLTGRQQEFALLKDKLQSAAAGSGQIVFLSGEAGIGKSRLVEELESYGRTLRVRMLGCRCTPGFQAPYLPFIDVLRDFLKSKNVSSPDELQALVREMCPELLPRLPVLRVFLDIREKNESELAGKEQLWDVVTSLITAIARDRLLILFVDDLHWADEASVEMLAYLCRNSSNARVLILGTYRPDEFPETSRKLEAEFQGNDRFSSLRLERLGTGAVREMVSSLFPDADFGKAFYDSLFQETEGNPFFLMETLKLLKMEGAIEKSEGLYRLKATYDLLSIPKSIHDIVMRRIDRLKEEEREILEIGAVEGESFHSGTIGACLEVSRIRLLKKLQSLERDHHIIHPEESIYRFDHGKIREFLYGAISPELRTEYHRMIAGFLSENFSAEEHLSDNIAHHFLNGGNEERALPFLVTAGERARRLFANKEAVGSYERALAISEKFGKKGSKFLREKEIVMEGLADVWALTGKSPEALSFYEQLSSLPGFPAVRRSDLLCKMGAVYVGIGENSKALAALQKAESELKTSQPSREREMALGKTRIARSRVLKSLGRYDDAKSEVEGGLAMIASDAGSRDLADAYNNLGVIYEDLGMPPLAEEFYTKSLTARQQSGDKKGVAVAYNNLGNLFYDQADYLRTVENLKKGLDIMTEIGYRSGIAGACNNLGNVYQDQGRYEESRRMHERCLALREEIGDAPGIGMSLCNLGSVLLDLGEYILAGERLYRGMEVFQKLGIRTYESLTYSWLAAFLLNTGRLDDAQKSALRAADISTELNQRFPLATAKRTLGIVGLESPASGGTDPWAGSGAFLKESLALFEELNMPLEIGRCCYHLARFYLKMGETDQCRDNLLLAKKIFQKLGALGELATANKFHFKP